VARLPSRRALALAVLLLPPLSGCDTSQVAAYDFVRDERLTISSPADRAEVRLPLTLRWSAKDFRVVGADGSAGSDRGRFAVFVDRPPMAAGKTVASVFDDDDDCQETPGCPDASYLERNGVFVTDRQELVLEELPELRRRDGAPDRHQVTVVLVNGRDRRIGESAAVVDFTILRKTR
jgi:hypothetical protein